MNLKIFMSLTYREIGEGRGGGRTLGKDTSEPLLSMPLYSTVQSCQSGMWEAWALFLFRKESLQNFSLLTYSA